MKHLYRSKDNRIIGGVLGGFGEYFNIDPVIVRLVFLVLWIVTGFVPGILVYVLAVFIVPLHRKPEEYIDVEIVEETPSRDQ